MLRVILSIFIAATIFAVNAFGQISLAERTFEQGTREAGVGNHQAALENYRRALLSATIEPIAADDFRAPVRSPVYYLQMETAPTRRRIICISDKRQTTA